jgi:membrane protein involved in colicin uptake
MQRSPFRGRYDAVNDRESAYEILQARGREAAAAAEAEAAAKAEAKAAKAGASRSSREPDSVWEAAAKSAVRAASSEVGRSIGKQLLRGLLGSLSKSMR